MENTIFDTTIFYEAVVEDIINETTLRLAIRDDDTKIVKVCVIDNFTVKEELKQIFILDLMKIILPIGSLIKIKFLDNGNIVLFNKGIDVNLSIILNIINCSNADYGI